MAPKSFSLLLFTTWFLFLALAANAQISTDTPIPPLQWINLSALLRGSSPPPLRDAAIGYDDTSRSLIIFGGESESGLVQSQTFLLNLETLTWSTPNPPNNLKRSPPPRSAAIYGIDLAASNREGFIIAGGRGSDGSNLTDVWEYDFNNEFWSEVNVVDPGPLPRWGAAGGIDLTTPFIQDPSSPDLINTFYLVGGYNGIDPSSLSAVWRLNISGTLSSNIPNGTDGSWDHLMIGDLPSKFNVSSTVVGQQVVLTGGCSSPSQKGACADQESYVIDAQRQMAIPVEGCPAPRTGPVLVRNYNVFTSAFRSQVYLLLGTLDETRWNDSNGLNKGEVAILDIQTGTWSRILPSGDPELSGTAAFPSPREGSVAVSHSQALVGSSRDMSSDVLIFGGQDPSGKLLSEMWLLRAYNGVINSSQLQWSGFGDGQLQTGIDATGTGVGVEIMTQCAFEITPNPTSTSHPTTTSPAVSSPAVSHLPNSTAPSAHSRFNTSVVHKVLSPVSLATFQAAFLFFRFSSPLYYRFSVQAFYGSAILLILAYGSGIAGLVIAFISISSQDPLYKGSLHLRTGHGIAGLIFFALLYVTLPGLLLLYGYFTQARAGAQAHETGSVTTFSPESLQNYWPPSRSAPQSLRPFLRHRTNSWGPSSVMHRSQESRVSSDSDSVRSSSPRRGGFEVVNRPPRTRRTSLLAIPTLNGTQERLREMDWLQRRRSLNAVGEIDYALSQVRKEHVSTPATADGLMTTGAPHSSQSQLVSTTVSEIGIHAIIQGLLLGLSSLTLVNLWFRAPKYGFAIFLAWTIGFYAIMIYFALRHRSECSFLSALCSLQNSPSRNMTTDLVPPPSLREVNPGPYVHQPPQRLTTAPDEISLSQGGPRSTETDEQEDDIDDDTRQRIIEEEMGRRDVSIVTIPKRKLLIANP